MVEHSDGNNTRDEPGSSSDGSVRADHDLRALLADKAAARITEDHIQSLLNARRGREALFGQQLFSDPAWDILLELYAAQLGDRQLSGSDLRRSIGLPESIIQRWIAALVRGGLIYETKSEAQDLTEPIIGLTADGAEKMSRLANRWSSAFLAI